MLLAMVSDAVWIALISGVVAAIASLAGVMTAYISLRSAMLKIVTSQKTDTDAQNVKLNTVVSDISAVRNSVETVEKATNGLTQKLIDVTRRAATAEGKAEGRAEQKAEQAATSITIDDNP